MPESNQKTDLQTIVNSYETNLSAILSSPYKGMSLMQLRSQVDYGEFAMNVADIYNAGKQGGLIKGKADLASTFGYSKGTIDSILQDAKEMGKEIKPYKMDAERVEQLVNDYNTQTGKSVKEIAKDYNISTSYFYSLLKKQKDAGKIVNYRGRRNTVEMDSQNLETTVESDYSPSPRPIIKIRQSHESSRYTMPLYTRLRRAGKAITIAVVTAGVAAIVVGGVIGGYMWGNSGKASLKNELELLKKQYNASLVEQTNERAKLAGEIKELKKQYNGLAEKTEQTNNLLAKSNEANQLLQEQIPELIDTAIQDMNAGLREQENKNVIAKTNDSLNDLIESEPQEDYKHNSNNKVTLSPAQLLSTGNFDQKDYNPRGKGRIVNKPKRERLNDGRIYPLTLDGCWNMEGRTALINGRKSDEEWTPGVEPLYGIGAVPVGVYEGVIGGPVRGLGDALGGNKGLGIVLKAPEYVIGNAVHEICATPGHIGEWLFPRKDTNKPNKFNIPIVSRLLPNYHTDPERCPIDYTLPSQFYNIDSTDSFLGNVGHGAKTGLKTWGLIELAGCISNDGGAKHVATEGQRPPGPGPGSTSIPPGLHGGF